MKKSLFIFCIVLCFVFKLSYGETLKAGVYEEYIPKGFYGSWGVISKIIETNNPVLFNSESKDIWILSGYSNVLLLENMQSGAKSQIIVKEKSKNNILKFEREKVVKKSENQKTIYKETVEFILKGDKFSGYDNFIVENYKSDKLIKKSTAKYKVSGVKISGENPN